MNNKKCGKIFYENYNVIKFYMKVFGAKIIPQEASTAHGLPKVGNPLKELLAKTLD